MDSNVSDKERQIALNFCNKFLDGAWKSASYDQVNVNTISGGMTNLLYRCSLSDDVKRSLTDDEPKQVLLRIYGSVMCNTPVQVKIFNQLADANLGPKLYSAFDEGRFEEYLPSNALTWQQMTDDSISQVIAKKIASIHRLEVPELDKVPGWLSENFRQPYEIVKLAQGKSLEFRDNVLETTRNIAKQMMAIDFNSEIKFMENLFKSLSVPLVLSHNDLHQNNIIYLHQPNMNLEDRIVLIDFEYCSYNYPTFDLANHLSEWCFDYTGDVYPNFNFSINKFPSEEKQRQFLTYYVQGYTDNEREQKERLFGSSLSDGDIVDLLYDDMPILLMASNLLWSIWAVKGALTSRIQFGYWEMSKCKWDVYMLCKQKFENNRSRRQDNNNIINLHSTKSRL